MAKRSTDETKTRFGRRLRELRRRAGLTQEQLGAQAGVGYKFLGSVERGNENPSLEVIDKLAAGLGVAPEVLFELEHTQKPEALRRTAHGLVDAADEPELKLIVRVLRAITV